MTCDTEFRTHGPYYVSHSSFGDFRVRRYERKPLSPDEQRVILELLQEHVETRRWYAVVVLRELVAEIAIPLN